MGNPGRPDLVCFGFSRDHAPPEAGAALQQRATTAAANGVNSIRRQFDHLPTHSAQQLARGLEDTNLTPQIAGIMVGNRVRVGLRVQLDNALFSHIQGQFNNAEYPERGFAADFSTNSAVRQAPQLWQVSVAMQAH